MSRGGFRGGRGGGRGGLSSAARLNSGAVPFDIDEELEKEFAKQKEDSDNFFPVSRPQIAWQLSHPTMLSHLVAFGRNLSLYMLQLLPQLDMSRALPWRRNLTSTMSKS
jgi:hypothetical protein